MYPGGHKHWLLHGLHFAHGFGGGRGGDTQIRPQLAPLGGVHTVKILRFYLINIKR